MLSDLSAQFPLLVDDEIPLVLACLQPAGRDLLDIGCGKAETTRRLASEGLARRAVGIEVDRAQLEKNAQQQWPANVEIRECGAQSIDFAADDSFDAATMFKSLHHVPVDLMDRAFSEIHRVLRPGGLLYVSEPVYDGPYNDIMRIFHDEGRVRQEAIAAVERTLAAGLFTRERGLRFFAPVYFKDFDAFRQRMLGVTHTRHVLSPDTMKQVEAAFRAHAAPAGARFLQPMRVDLLRSN